MRNYIQVFVCSKCGKSFKRARSNVKNKYKKTNLIFCSKECWYQHLRDEAKVENFCPVCGKKTFELKMNVKNGPRCCSRECGWIKERRRTEIKCLQCGKEIQVTISNKNKKFCSRKCDNEYRRKNQIEITCPNCGGKVKKSKATVERVKKSFCSEKCLREYWKGENAPTWKGGKTSTSKIIRGSAEYKKWRQKVFERDNFTCQKCQKRGGYLHPHHLKEFADYPELRFDVNNGITLCHKCHGKIHGITYIITKQKAV